jgi:hypothetical protein
MAPKKSSGGSGKKSASGKRSFTEKPLSEKKKSTLKKKKISSSKKRTAKASAASKKAKINKELVEIYENRDGSMPDMSAFKTRKSTGFLRALATLLFSIVFLAGVAWLGFFVFQPNTDFSGDDIVLSISGDEKVKAGEEIQFRIRYKNAQRTMLENVSLEVRYPSNFVFGRSNLEPDSEDKNKWDIGELPSGDGGIIDVYGTYHGNIGEAESLRAFLNYRPKNFNSDFQKASSFNTSVTKSPVTLDVDIVGEISRGTETPFTIKVNKDGDLPGSIGKYFVRIQPSDDFNLKSSDPVTDTKDEMIWELEDLSEERTINVVGLFDADGEKAMLNVQLLGVANGKTLDDATTLEQEKVEAKLVDTTVSTTLVINGGAGDLSAQPGEKLNVSVNVKNTGTDALKNVKVRLVFDAPSAKKKSILHWARLNDAENGSIQGEQLSDELRRGQITWDSRHIRDLKSLEAGESVTIDVQMPIKDENAIDLAGFTTADAKIFADIQFDGQDEKQTVASSPITLTINSDLSFEVRSDLDDDMYTLTWLLNNTFHELENISISADFFGDVSFDEKTTLTPPAGKANIDNAKKRLTWTIDSMPTAVDVLAYQYKVKLHSTNAGQTNLSSKIRLEATDKVTGEKILKAIEGVLLQ